MFQLWEFVNIVPDVLVLIFILLLPPILTEDVLDLVVDSEGEQRFRKLSEECLQDHSRNVDVRKLIKVYRFP